MHLRTPRISMLDRQIAIPSTGKDRRRLSSQRRGLWADSIWDMHRTGRENAETKSYWFDRHYKGSVDRQGAYTLRTDFLFPVQGNLWYTVTACGFANSVAHFLAFNWLRFRYLLQSLCLGGFHVTKFMGP